MSHVEFLLEIEWAKGSCWKTTFISTGVGLFSPVSDLCISLGSGVAKISDIAASDPCNVADKVSSIEA